MWKESFFSLSILSLLPESLLPHALHDLDTAWVCSHQCGAARDWARWEWVKSLKVLPSERLWTSCGTLWLLEKGYDLRDALVPPAPVFLCKLSLSHINPSHCDDICLRSSSEASWCWCSVLHSLELCTKRFSFLYKVPSSMHLVAVTGNRLIHSTKFKILNMLLLHNETY